MLISQNELLQDDWVRLAEDEPVETGGDKLIVSSARLQAQWQQLGNAPCELGLVLKVDDIVEDFLPYLGRLGLVILDFPSFTDGRAFSQARLLRHRFGFKGEIRAVGDVLRDQLSFMQRCGFSQYQLADKEQADLALKAFSDIRNSYQPVPGKAAVA